MKTLSISGFVLALLGIGVGIYNQFTFVAAYHAHLCKTDILSQRECLHTQDMQLILGQTAIVAGAVALLLCIFPALKSKKSYFSYFGILFAALAVLIGLMQATHMFDYTGYFAG